jgi:hypothetical protein
MEHDYTLNHAVPILLGHIEPGSTEKEVQALVENVLWTVFPAADNWVNLTKYKQGATEPDNKTMKCIQYTGGWATVDVLMFEVKRLQEDTSMKAFIRVANNLLDDYMVESNNPDGSTLFGGVGIGFHVVFFEKVLPRHKLKIICERPLHWWDDALIIQPLFNWIKEHVPTSSATAPAGPSQPEPPQPEPPQPEPSQLETGQQRTGDWSEWSWNEKYNCESRYRENSIVQGGWEYEYRPTQTKAEPATTSHLVETGQQRIGDWSEWYWSDKHGCEERYRENSNVSGGWDYDYRSVKSSKGDSKYGKGKGKWKG